MSSVRAAAQGHSPLDPRVTRALLGLPGDDSRGSFARAHDDVELSARERQVLRLVGQGLANKQIGRALGITERTVKAHLGNIFRRIGVADRTSAALWAKDHLADQTS
jgi:DNA-binding NarL/FixJ family response regulator